MSGWQVGDLALCIKQSQWFGEFPDCYRAMPVSFGPECGKTYTVSHLVIDDDGLLFLVFPEWQKERRCWLASRFIKVTPPREMIEQERKVEVPA